MQKFSPHSYQRYCISRCITDEQLGLFLDMRIRENSNYSNSNK